MKTSAREEIRRFAEVGGFCRTTELANFLGTTTDHIRNLCQEGKLDAEKIPGSRQILVLRSSVLEMFERGETADEGPRRRQEA